MYNSHANISGEYKPSFITKVKIWFLKGLRLTDQPTVKVYHAFGNADHITVIGHAFHFSPIPRKRFTKNFITNILAVLRLFMVKPYANAKVSFIWGDEEHFCTTERDGFYRFEIKNKTEVEPGFYDIEVKLHHHDYIRSAAKGTVMIPFINQYAMISDIDDTFLISHSSNLRKRLFVLLTQNAHSRKPFEGVVKHYQLLAEASVKQGQKNPFFFVSSSEWNLYDYIREFSIKNDLPQGIYLLNQLKTFSQLWKTGANNHATKFTRIVRILENYPGQKFILLGDDSQEDPNIYASIVEHYPGKIFAVYIRKVRKVTKETVMPSIEKMKAVGVNCCYFTQSIEAISHSEILGLISTTKAAKADENMATHEETV